MQLESNETSVGEEPYLHPWMARLPLIARVVLAIVALFPWAFGFISVFRQGRWLPTQAWLEASNTVAIAVWVGWIPFTLIIYLLGVRPKRMWKDPDDRVEEIAKRVFLALVPGLVLYPFVTGVVRTGFPAVHAAFRGEQVSHEFVVRYVGYGGGKICAGNVDLRDMPLLVYLCGVPDELRKQLRPGMKVIVSGKGSWMGVAPEQLRIDDGG